MGQVVFHTGLANKVDYAARLVRKASRQGVSLVLVCEDPAAVSQVLWGVSGVDFVAHASEQSETETLLASKVVLMKSAAVPCRDLSQVVLVNACEAWPNEHARYLRVIELVGENPSDVGAGRERWKHYVSDGVQPSKMG
jgi:DNA polymerase-3 subunit chi